MSSFCLPQYASQSQSPEETLQDPAPGLINDAEGAGGKICTVGSGLVDDGQLERISLSHAPSILNSGHCLMAEVFLSVA